MAEATASVHHGKGPTWGVNDLLRPIAIRTFVLQMAVAAKRLRTISLSHNVSLVPAEAAGDSREVLQPLFIGLNPIEIPMPADGYFAITCGFDIRDLQVPWGRFCKLWICFNAPQELIQNYGPTRPDSRP